MNDILNLGIRRFTAGNVGNIVIPVRRFIDWWGDQLRALLPPALRSLWFGDSVRLFVDVVDDALVVSGGDTTYGRIDPADPKAATVDIPVRIASIVLRLPPSRTMTTRFDLPLAAAENLRDTVAFQIDRRTPFVASAVCFDCRVVAQDTASQQLGVELTLAPRASIDELLDALSDAGLDVDAVVALPESGTANRGVDLLPADRRRPRRDRRRQAMLALGALNLLLLLLVVAVPVWQKAQVIANLEMSVQEAVASARQGIELRREFERLTAASTYLRELKGSRVRFVALLDELSERLPDHTWINRIDFGGDTIQIQGQSTEAASLIRTLEASPSFRSAQFRSPVLRVGETNEERFHLSAEIVGETKP